MFFLHVMSVDHLHACKSPRRTSVPLELKLQTVVRHCVGPGSQTLPSVEQSALLTPGPSISPALTLFLHLLLFVFGEVCRAGCLDLTPLLPLPPEGGGTGVHYTLAEVCSV